MIKKLGYDGQMISRPLIFCLALLSLSFFLCLPAQAQRKLSNGEDVAFAFFKTGGTNPDFDKWARNSDGYKTAAPAFINQYIEEEKQRLIRKWQEYGKYDTTLEMRMDVAVHLKHSVAEDGTEQFWMNIDLPKDEVFYFPFTYQDYNFAVMPQEFGKAALQTIHKAQYELMLAEFEGKTSGTAYLYTQLKPVKAYMDEPYKLDNTEQWALIADVATLSLRSFRTGTSLWDYSAQWYASPIKKELNTLYSKPETVGIPQPATPGFQPLP